MTKEEIDAAIAAQPDMTAILLTEPHWRALTESRAAQPHLSSQTTEIGYHYRGLRLLVVSPGPSRLSKKV